VILTDREIQIALQRSQITIEPPPLVEAYSSTSVDLRLDPDITEFDEALSQDDSGVEIIIDPGHKNFVAEKTLSKITRSVPIGPEGYLLYPRKLVLGWTVERVEIPIFSRLAARVEGKSSLARLGLGIHVTAPTIHSGFNFPIRLELINHGHVPIRLRKEMRICQLVFEVTMGTAQKGFSPLQSAPVPQSSGS
jgi:dCTP deaminase